MDKNNPYNIKESSSSSSIENLSRAIFTVNRHAKTAPDPKYLYTLKRKSLEKLINEGKAVKKGLHYSRNPKRSRQQSDVLVVAGEYYFHIPAQKEDFQILPHLGELNDEFRNPKTHMSLSAAKKILQSFTQFYPEDLNTSRPTYKHQPKKPVFKRLGESYR